jgi:hypothetical protein
MRNFRIIWNHEVKQVYKIARSLFETRSAKPGWSKINLPSRLYDYIRLRPSLILTRKNFLFTKQLAFDAAKEIFQGKDRSLEIRLIEIKTKKILDKEKKGYYTEKIRRKQLHEIELLIDHYLDLLNTNATDYAEMIKIAYQSKKKYLFFLNQLQQNEQEVIEAAITSMRKGSKKERLEWFEKVQETFKKTRMEEVERIFPLE